MNSEYAAPKPEFSHPLMNAAGSLGFAPFPGGALLHTGHPNPGLSSAIKQHAAAWARSEVPIIIHLISNKPEEVRNAVLRVEGLENVIAVELGIESDNASDFPAGSGGSEAAKPGWSHRDRCWWDRERRPSKRHDRSGGDGGAG
jgi:hypothetical protein